MKVNIHSANPKNGCLGYGVYGSVDNSEGGSSRSKRVLELDIDEVLVIDPIKKGFTSSFVCSAIPEKFDEECPSFELLVKNKDSGAETIVSVVSVPQIKVREYDISELRKDVLEKNGLPINVDCSINFREAFVELYNSETLDEIEEESKIDLQAFVEKYALGDFDIAMLKLEAELQNAIQEKFDIPTYGLSDFVVDSTSLLEIAKSNGYSAVRLIAEDLDVIAIDPECI